MNKDGHRIPERDCDNLEVTISVKDVKTIIKEQPTAYDVGKVVDELEEWSFETKILVPNNNELGEYEEEVERKIICTQNAIEIVKSSGVSDDDVCEWHCDEYGRCHTECHYLADNDPLEYIFCPYCGKKMKVVE